MELTKETKSRITNDANSKFKQPGFENGLINVGKLELLVKQAYISGAESEASKAAQLVNALEKIKEMSSRDLASRELINQIAAEALDGYNK